MRKAAVLILAVCIILSFAMAGCGQAGSTGNETTALVQTTAAATQQETSKAEEPYQFSIFRATWTELNDQTDLVIGELNKRLNIKIKVLTAPYETWVDKYNVLMASNETPDLSVVGGPGKYGYDQYVEQGKYLDITDMYQKYPNIAKWVPQSSINAVKINGKLYCIPKPYMYEDALIFRADWLKKLNLSMPTTLDELYNVLKAFATQDPDGNGKADTYGFLTEDSLYTTMYFYGAYGVYGSPYDGYQWYKKDDGTIESTLLQPGAKEATKFLAKLYKEKILDPEWMVTKSQALFDKFEAGKGGCINSNISQMYIFESDMKKTDPNITLDATTKITGPDGKFGKDLMLPYYMTCSISSKAKRPEKILEFLDYLLSDDGVTLLNYGVEGVSFSKDAGGKITLMDGAAKQYGLEGGHKFTWMMSRADWSFPNDDRGNKYRDMCKWFVNQQPALPSVTLPSAGNVTAKQGPDMVMKVITNMIIGKTNIDTEWDKMIKQWKETGGDQLTKEENELLVTK